MKQPYFPADYKNLPSKIEHKNLQKKFNIEDIFIETIENNHPSGCVGLKFTYKNKKISFITDNELLDHGENITTKKDFSDFIKDTDIFVHDAQYTKKEIESKRGWGHSTFDDVIEIAKMGGNKKVVFTHHDPMRRDKELKEILNGLKEKNKKLKLTAAKEGMEIKFDI
jgi:ribonuclease BN (tRNA processing enzyme)